MTYCFVYASDTLFYLLGGIQAGVNIISPVEILDRTL